MENTRFTTRALMYSYNCVSAFSQKLLLAIVMIGEIGKPKWFVTIVAIVRIGYAVYYCTA